MPWKECSVIDESPQFVARRLAGEAMAELCREFGTSRKTSYKISDRYQECGVQGLTDRNHRPYRYAPSTSLQVENYILNGSRSPDCWCRADSSVANGFHRVGVHPRPRSRISRQHAHRSHRDCDRKEYDPFHGMNSI
jgi:hypothetical protein